MQSSQFAAPFLGEMQSPFIVGPLRGEAASLDAGVSPAALSAFESPFRSSYLHVGEGPAVDLDENGRIALATELYSPSFNSLLHELVGEAFEALERVRDPMTGEVGGWGDAEVALEAHFAPLVAAAEAGIDQMAAAVHGIHSRDQAIAAMEAAAYSGPPLAPEFENFLGGLWNKVKTAAKKVASVASSLGLGPILAKIKVLVRPLIKRVLRMAIGRLPAQLQGAARLLARKIGFESPGEGATHESDGMVASGDLGAIQREFDARLVSIAESAGQPGGDAVIMNEVGDYERAADLRHDDLGAILREQGRLAERLVSLREGEDPQPDVEQFIPAILPALKIGINMIGRPKVVNFLAGMVSKLIQPLVGNMAQPLATAITDTGLKMLALEAVDERAVAGNALASLVQETTAAVALETDRDPSLLDDPVRLGMVVQEAFEQASADNVPPHMLNEAVRKTVRATGTWARVRGKPFKKFSQVFDVDISWPQARAVLSFGDEPLSQFLRRRAGFGPGKVMRVRVHLYEAVQGTWLSKISKADAGVPGLGSAAQASWSQIHPLTPEASCVLLHEPLLGRRADARWLRSRDHIAVGQRFYYIELPAGTAPPPLPQPQPGPGPGRQRPHRTGVKLKIDLRNRKICLAVHLEEADAQEVAKSFRKGHNELGGLRLVEKVIDRFVESAMRHGLTDLVKITKEMDAEAPVEMLMEGEFKEQAAKWLLKTVKEAAIQWLKEKRDDFVEVADKPANGVTIAICLIEPPILSAIVDVMRGRSGVLKAGLGAAIGMFTGRGKVDVRLMAGYWSP
ncbi:MAG: hypothetical protein AB1918_04655 [Pseudomonadota bacterium]